MALSRADIQRAFQNSLGRPASPEDEDNYFNASQQGEASDTQLYAAISNSREADLNADPVVRFYQAAFGRVPDQAGLDNATDYVRQFGATPETYQKLADMFAQSPEFQARFPGTAVDAAYVQSLYSAILGRTASLGEVESYVSGANGYDTRGEVLYAISQSNEAISRTGNAVNAFLFDAAEGDATYVGSLLPNGPTPDTTLPSVTISVANSGLVAGQTTQVTFDFSEQVAGFDLSDVRASRGELSDLVQSTTDPTIYTATYTASDTTGGGTIELTGTYTDLAGNIGSGASTSVSVSPTDTPNPNQTLVLTPQTDTLDAQDGNDVFVGTVNSINGPDTFTQDDDLDGGAGTDTLQLAVGAAANTVDLGIATLTSVERLELNIDNADLDNIEFAEIPFSEVSVDFGGNLQNATIDLNSVLTNTNLSFSNADFDNNDIDVNFAPPSGSIDGSTTLTNITEIDFAIEFDTTNQTSGDNDRYTINLDNVQADQDGDFDFQNIETLNINVLSDSAVEDIDAYRSDNTDFLTQVVNFNLVGNLQIGEEPDDTNSLDISDTSDAQVTINVVGAGDLTIFGLDDGVGVSVDITINAETATGAIDISNVDPDTGTLDVTFGAANDRLTLRDGYDLSGLSYDGGDGIDILGLALSDLDNFAAGAPLGPVDLDITSVETLEITGAASGVGALDLTAVGPEGVDNLILSSDVGADFTFQNLNGTLTIAADQTSAIVIEPGSSSTGTLEASVEGGGIRTASSLDVSGYEAVRFDLADGVPGSETDLTLTGLVGEGVDTFVFRGGDQSDVDIDALDADDLNTLDLTALTGSFTNAGAELNDESVEVLLGNLNGSSTIDLAALGTASDRVVVGPALTADIVVNNFTGGTSGSGGDIVDLSAYVGNYVIDDTGPNVVITLEAGNTITLTGVTGFDASDNIVDTSQTFSGMLAA